jgi:hypothetical protein
LRVCASGRLHISLALKNNTCNMLDYNRETIIIFKIQLLRFLKIHIPFFFLFHIAGQDLRFCVSR